MQKRDIEALGELAGKAGLATALERDKHAGIACRVFDSVGPASRPT